MDFISEQKFLLVSPKKIRPLASLAKKLTPIRAIDVLPFSGKKASEPLVKVIKSAVANARVKGVSEESLTFKEIRISEGPSLKRGRPVSRGRWHPFTRRMSHIRVILETKEEPKEVKKEKEEIEVKKEEK
uniref:50S ribosomal protein L22 n=1 Tax=uncultured Microgenomates bacterium Rifle_16ft_4_minimus_24682 TaxID=1665111 RepID=A0A0H4TC36_9BACT|nr:50S ribosomal protein L22, large subunit ribosomal protein L22 [uncultured Microgenomates bacterium Rifle_16ft_4_minimus_24682]